MYEEVFQSSDRPFRATPDATFYFPHESVEVARRSVVRAALRAEGPTMVLGGAGLGKSLLGEVIASDLAEQFDIVRLNAARLCSRRALLQTILFELQMPYRGLSEGELRLSILGRLEPNPEFAPEGVFIIVDEAHVLPPKLLDELRLISNYNRHNQPRTRIVLIGNLGLEETFAHPQLESFSQRLAARCYLQPMNHQQTQEFIRHQLRVAGASAEKLITQHALDTIFAASEGVPRLANQLMDHTLVLAMSNDRCPISSELVDEAWADLQQLPAPWHVGLNAAEQIDAGGVEFGELSDDEVDEDLEESEAAPTEASAIAVTPGLEALSGDPLFALVKTLEWVETDEVLERQNSLEPPTDRVENTGDAGDNPSEPEIASEQGGEPAEPPINVEVTSATQRKELTHEQTDAAEEEQWGRNKTMEQDFFAAFVQPSPPTTEADAVGAVADASVDSETDSHSGSGPADSDGQTEESDTAPVSANQSVDFPRNKTSQYRPDAFFENQPTDEQLIAFEQVQQAYDKLGFWENDPPIGADEDSVAKRPVTIQPLNFGRSTADLFGSDFEEEVPIPSEQFVGGEQRGKSDACEGNWTEPVALTGTSELETGAAEQLADVGRFDVTADLDVPKGETVPSQGVVCGELAAYRAPTLGEAEAFIAEIEQALRQEKLSSVDEPLAAAEPTAHRVEDAVESDDCNAPPRDVPSACELLCEPDQEMQASTPLWPISSDCLANASDASTPDDLSLEQQWAVDVTASEAAQELRLQHDIEDLVSQLNFAAFTVEPFSVEQISVDSPSPSAAKSPEVQQAASAAYVVYANDGSAADAEATGQHVDQGGQPADSEMDVFLTAGAGYDDDRDMLVIEEDIAVSDQVTDLSAVQPAKATTTPYSQLFAKLRK